MSTIRPLATIAILAGLGVFLAHQINKPTGGGDQLTADWQEAPAYDAGGTAAAPAFSPDSIAPPLGAPPAAAPPAAPPVASSVGPVAPAPGAPTAEGLPPLPALPSNPAPPLGSPGLPPVTAQPPAATAPPEIPMPEVVTEANLNGMAAEAPAAEAVVGLAPPPAGSAPPVTPPVAQPPAATDPYQPYSAPAAATPPVGGPVGQPPTAQGPTFRDALPAINQALDRGELTRAHALLSSWYGDPGLSPEERGRVNDLLGQLAGTVVYSTEHRLEPPYTVKPGETLKTIASQYNVPWRLLAKINGVPTAEAVQPGQTLKVLRGPFNAVVDAANNELVMMIDGKYAGKFPVQLSGAAQQAGSWTVQAKPAGGPVAYGPPAGKQLVMKDSSGMATLVVGSGGGSPMERGRVSVASNDLNELHDILSVGSTVTIMR